jgi:hypothetical protein
MIKLNTQPMKTHLIVGPRLCGKSTLVAGLLKELKCALVIAIGWMKEPLESCGIPVIHKFPDEDLMRNNGVNLYTNWALVLDGMTDEECMQVVVTVNSIKNSPFEHLFIESQHPECVPRLLIDDYYMCFYLHSKRAAHQAYTRCLTDAWSWDDYNKAFNQAQQFDYIFVDRESGETDIRNVFPDGASDRRIKDFKFLWMR